jgi:hypothetical protein
VAQIVGTTRIDLIKVMVGASNSPLVDAAEVVSGQHRARAHRDAAAASRAGEDEEVGIGVAVGWELPTDGLDYQWGKGQLPAQPAAGLTACLGVSFFGSMKGFSTTTARTRSVGVSTSRVVPRSVRPIGSIA